MKTHINTRGLIIVTTVALSFTMGFSPAGYSQNKPGKDKEKGKVEREVIRMKFDAMDMDSLEMLPDSVILRIVHDGMKNCQGHMKEAFQDFPDRFEMPEMDMQVFGGDNFPEFRLPSQWESLMQSIPMGNIQGFKIKDRRHGKRIIIDVDDEHYMVMPPRMPRQSKEMKRIIIQGDVRNIPAPPMPPAPPAPAPAGEPGQSAPAPEKG